ncbi:MAG: thioredoxin family protein [bacterium]|nr:thioredoxin family protein [bacterium]
MFANSNLEVCKVRNCRLMHVAVFVGVVFACLTICGCADDPVQPVTPEWVYGDEPLADVINWTSTDVIWSAGLDKKPYSILIIGADWCGWCKKLMDETMHDRSVMGWVDSCFDACTFDSDSDSLIVIASDTISCYEAAKQVLNVRALPTTIVFDKQGNETNRRVGYLPAKSYAEFLWQVVSGK